MKQFETDMTKILNRKKKMAEHIISDSAIEEKKILIDLMLKFGVDIQLVIAIEEMSELTKELTKLMRMIRFEKPDTDYTDIKLRIVEEIADTEICIMNLKLLMEANEINHLNFCKNQKFDKIQKLVNGDEIDP